MVGWWHWLVKDIKKGGEEVVVRVAVASMVQAPYLMALTAERLPYAASHVAQPLCTV